MQQADFSQLKEVILKLFREDEEFRYAVAGLIGLQEILRRLEEHDKKFNEILCRIESIERRLEEHDRKFNEILCRIEQIEKRLEEHSKVLEEHSKRLEEHSKAIRALQEEIKRLSVRIDALGARWGIVAENVVREALTRFLQEYLGVAKVEKWMYHDREGKVFGYPAVIDLDIVVKDGVHYLVEVKSSTTAGDVILFNRKCELYAELNKVPIKKLIITCYADDKAREAAAVYNVEIVTY